MKNEYVFIIVMAIAALIFMGIGICVGEMESDKLGRINRAEELLEEVAERGNHVSLGTIDGYAISRKNGKTYDGPAIREELFKRIGKDVPENSWAFELGEYEGIYLVRFVEYEGERHEPITEQTEKAVYLYGVY